MTPLHLILTHDRAPDEVTRPDAAKVLSGDPVHTTWLHEERGPLFAGIWQSSPGTWRVSYEEWEYFNVLSGAGRLIDTNGTQTPLTAGSRHIIRPGFHGVFEVTETLTKDFVILT
jgi:uncharacterized protein